jgi:hypothetical protein
MVRRKKNGRPPQSLPAPQNFDIHQLHPSSKLPLNGSGLPASNKQQLVGEQDSPDQNDSDAPAQEFKLNARMSGPPSQATARPRFEVALNKVRGRDEALRVVGSSSLPKKRN